MDEMDILTQWSRDGDTAAFPGPCRVQMDFTKVFSRISYNPSSQGFIQRPPQRSLIWTFYQTHLKSRRLNEALHHQSMNGGTHQLFPGNLRCVFISK